jgi:hypothetical protein
MSSRIAEQDGRDGREKSGWQGLGLHVTQLSLVRLARALRPFATNRHE